MSGPPLRAVTIASLSRGGCVALAPAKVNLFLELRGRRPDGYHALETLLVGVSLTDTLEVRKSPGAGVAIRCDAPGVPTDASNLVAKAAAELSERVGRELGAEVRLTKRIPHAAGLGGGSSDAAAMLVALDAIYDLESPPDLLAAAAAAVGSDVPAFLVGPAAWCAGRGEVVTPAAVGGPLHLVIVKPRAGLPTAAVYGACEVPASPTSGGAARRALAEGDAHAVAASVFNRLAAPAERLLPELVALREALLTLGALAATVSGSGSSVFAVCADAASARGLASGVSGRGEAFAVRAG